MSTFQGPGTGISGTSNQFSVGYAQSSGYSNGYAQSAGNINGYAPQAGYANQSAATAANIQSAQGVNGTNWAWSGQGGTPGHLWGGNVGSQYAVWAPNQMYVGSSGYATYAPSAVNVNGYATVGGYANQLGVQTTNSTTWGWAGQNGTPSWMWGSNDGKYIPIWQFGNSYVGSAGYAPTASYANYSDHPQSSQGNYAQSAGTVNGGSYSLQGAGITGLTSLGYNGLYSGYVFGIFIQGVLGSFFNFKRSTGGNTADRFVVYYNTDGYQANYNQYGYWNGGWGQVSDAREKEDIDDLDETKSTNFIKNLRPRKFRWNNSSDQGKHRRSGFIAQEVLSVAPSEEYMHIVNNGQKYLDAGASLDITNLDSVPDTVSKIGVSQMEIVSPLVKTVQALMKDIEDMKTTVALMKKINIQ